MFSFAPLPSLCVAYIPVGIGYRSARYLAHIRNPHIYLIFIDKTVFQHGTEAAGEFSFLLYYILISSLAQTIK